MDVGNTRAHLALFEGETLVARIDVAHNDGDEVATASFDAFADGRESPSRFAIASVNGSGHDRVVAWATKRFGLEARVLLGDLPAPSALGALQGSGVGADRVANACWASHAFPGEAAVVVGLGTAVVFDVVSPQGMFLGGAIAAGLRPQARALSLLTDKLPEVTLERDDWPPPALGQTTIDCLEGGLVWGLVGLVETTCAQLVKELGMPLRVVATGGDAHRIAPLCPVVERIVPDATLEGVRLALVDACG